MSSADGPLPVSSPLRRRHELDAVRTFVVLGLVFFHSALVFDANDDYYVKNDQTTEVTTYLAGLAVVWAMPMLFLIAGMGSWFSLRRRSPAAFLRARVVRLFVPVVVATVTIIPIPVWFRLRADPAYQESYWQFLPSFFVVQLEWSDFPFVLDGPRFETGHLWFVVLLLAFSVVLLPVFLWLSGMAGQGWVAHLAVQCRRRGMILLAAVPLAVIGATLPLEEDKAAWNRWAYLVFFLYGFLVASDGRFLTAAQRDAAVAAAVGVVAFLAAVALLVSGDAAGRDPFVDYHPASIAGRAFFGAAGWLWVIAILGLVTRPRPRRSGRADAGPADTGRIAIRPAVWAYLHRAALPFYIVHQPVVVAIAFYVVRSGLPAGMKYVVIVCASTATILIIYDLLIRRLAISRLLFGLN